MSFWTSPTGNPITGSPDKAFIKDFATIPEGTMALASIKSFEVTHTQANEFRDGEKFIEVKYKLIDGDFKNREVSQKIKVFEGKPEQIERNLNMLKLVMDLCSFKPIHNEEPTNDELSRMNGKIVGIKIGEWSMPKADGTTMDGNFVREVHASTGFVCETGVKKEVVHTNSAVETAFSRNPYPTNNIGVDSDLPF